MERQASGATAEPGEGALKQGEGGAENFVLRAAPADAEADARACVSRHVGAELRDELVEDPTILGERTREYEAVRI